MALFGFNKEKVLSSAEKYVQQGKLQNAIAEYEKVLKNDAKDLTVTNTVGDLYSRLGDTDKAVGCFKTVGDAYAGQGFTVKAIAMYKKICKLQPSVESLLKLAELYSQQGLFNDARAQYLQVAEEFLKAGELEHSVRIFQKILEMDPENSNMRVRLAEVYVRLGKKTEAWEIFTAAAESMRSKGSLSGAEEILQRMLTLDPGNNYALLMQGKNLIESGDAAGSIAILQKVTDIDSNVDGLRDLLKAYLQAGQLSDAGTVATKLLTVHNDLAAISTFADALMQAGQFETALQVYDQHAERLLAENADKVLDSLHAIIGHVRDNPDSLQKLLDLFQKAGENTHINEVLELLAHASVQAGDLPRARDLYQKLSVLEPQNALHMQNYQQVLGQLGGTSGSKLITPDEAVVLIDDLEATAPSIHQHYTDEIALAVRSALTDAELFISYNMPAKALAPLVGALPLAPSDQRLNQRLAALHTRAGRFDEAAVCCRTLQTVYSEADHPEEASRYGELAERYEERSSTPLHAAPSEEEHIFLDAAPQAQDSPVQDSTEEEPQTEVAEFSIDEAPADPAETGTIEVAEESAPEEMVVEAAAEPEFAVVEESAAEPAAVEAAAEAGPEEIDLSSEWDDSITIEGDAPAEESAAEPATPEFEVAEVQAPEVEAEAVEAEAEVPKPPAAPARKTAAPKPAAKQAQKPAENPAKIDEVIEEIRFYIGHGMPEQAMAAFAKLETLTRDKAKIAQLRSEIDAALQAAAEQESAAAEPAVEELATDDIPSAEAEVPEVEVSAAEVPEIEVEAAEAVPEIEVSAPEIEVEAPEVEVVAEAASEDAPVVEEIPVEPVTVEEMPVAVETAEPEVEQEIEVTAESVAVEEIPVVAAAPVEPVPAPAQPAPVQKIAAKSVQKPTPKPIPAAVAPPVQKTAAPVAQKPAPAPAPAPIAPPASVQAPAPLQAAPAPAPGALNDLVADLESSLGEGFMPGSAPAASPRPVAPAQAAQAEPAAPAPPAPAVLGEFVADIEASLGEDFLKAAPVAQTQAPAAPPLAASAAASASPTSPVTPQAPQTGAIVGAPTAVSSVAWHAPAAPKPQPPLIQPPAMSAVPSRPAAAVPAAAPPVPAAKADAGVDLAEMFGELKQDLEADVATADEDPETHYNLGIAFREMGLLDEAIGELQKTCQAFDRGKPFSQIMQSYTWLAQCFLDKGVPEAAIRWYDKALTVPGIDAETRTALYYELGSAFEAAGDKASALQHFTTVYGSNIDYRDVAERIKALKS